jgi:hypothetical protein
MSNVQLIEAELEKLMPEEIRQVRDWLDDLLEDELEFTEEFAAQVEQSERDRAAGQPAQTR